MACMHAGIGNRGHQHRASAGAGGVLCLVMLGLALGPACGGHSSSLRDASAAASTGGAGGSGQLGSGGAGSDANGAGDAALAVGCSYLPCLATAVSTVAGCQPSDTCTYQTTTTGAVVRCFSNGLTVILHTPAAGMAVMGVKKDGSFCYGVDSVGTSGSLAVTVTYRDGNNETMITVFTDDAGATHAECPGASGSFSISPTSPCMTAIAALGGITPASACAHASEDDCRY
jgi:hypothetical protein